MQNYMIAYKSFTVQEVAEILNISTQTVRRFIKQDKIASFRIGKNIRIPYSEIERLTKAIQE